MKMTTNELNKYPIAHNLSESRFWCDGLWLYLELPNSKVLEMYFNDATEAYHIIGVSDRTLEELIGKCVSKSVFNN